MSRALCAALALLGIGAGCDLLLSPAERLIHARFDPEAKVLPMPTDILRDAAAGHLELPVDDPALSATELELRAALNQLDGWSTVSSPSVKFSGPIAASSITSENVRVWRWLDGALVAQEGLEVALSEDRLELAIKPPPSGWPRGAVMVVGVRGGARGVLGAGGERVECEPAFYFLRLKKSLLDPSNDYRAFPGATFEERREKAAKLAEIQTTLAPFFDDLEAREGTSRQEWVALWKFTVTERTEVVMDKATSRMPLPIDLLVNQTTGRVDLPALADDTPLEAEAKRQLARYDGFSTTGSPMFEFTAPVDSTTVTPATVHLYRLGTPPTELPIDVEVSSDLLRAQVNPKALPLDEKTTYAVVLGPGIRDAMGRPVAPMLPGLLLRLAEPLLADGKSRIGSLPDEDARQVEPVRARLKPLADQLGRSAFTAAWPFTTLSVVPSLVDAQQTAERLQIGVDPEAVERKSSIAAALDFPLGVLSLYGIEGVYSGTIKTADFLDPITHTRRVDGSWVERKLPFMLTIPDSASQSTPVPVVIFGHGLTADRRTMLAVASALAVRGFAAIAIDFPYHGARTVCAWNGPACFPNPLEKDEGKLICPNPCRSGSTCAADGRCIDANGQPTELAVWPVYNTYQASGAAFVDIEQIWGTRDHFFQAVTDLGALSRVVRTGNWQAAIGYRLRTDRIHYLGQSLGGVIGALYTPLDGTVERAVLNVPGANLVPLFDDSKLFHGHITAFLTRQHIEAGSAEYQRFFHIAHWIVDPIDPANVARYIQRTPLPEVPPPSGRAAFAQMAKLDFVIPSANTIFLTDLAAIPRKDYLSEHAFLTMPLDPSYWSGVKDAADFLEGSGP